jgi:YHS domain-containing protein
VSGDTEYYCPMDPGVVSDWPAKCGVCNMTLVRRMRGDMGPLPDGVLARMQASPYRLHLGGIVAEAVAYRPLAFEFRAPIQQLASQRVRLTLGADDADLLRDVHSVRVTIDKRTSRGRVADVADEFATIDLDDKLQVDTTDVATVAIDVSDLEIFRSQPVGPPPYLAHEPRFAYSCPKHPAVVRSNAGTCPRGGEALERRALAGDERLRWRCVTHPEFLTIDADEPCPACGAPAVGPERVRFRPRGKVAAIPESAVIDTGLHRLVYVERMPGTFDAVEVQLGPRCGDLFPVIAGVVPGDRVVAQGTFLVDAETRLNSAAAVAYFGASSGGAPNTDSSPAGDSVADENEAIARQSVCPVTGKKLGSMGAPYRVQIAGRTIYLCCEGCEPELRQAPEKYLAKRPGPTPPRHQP